MAWVLPVLTEEDLNHIAAHKYRPGVYTPLDNALSPFWQRIAEALPRWLAPNAITFIGFAPLVLVYTLSWHACPFCDVAPPRWLALSYATALYFYQTMDAVDGKQARRTGSSTPLGHLVDHGCDCLTGMSQHAALSMILMPGDMYWVLQCMRSIQTPIFLAAWQDRHTGFFPTSIGPIGVTELQYALMSPILLTAIVGPEVWQSWMTATVELPWASETIRLLIMKATVQLHVSPCSLYF
ncbi:chpt1 [Symbiodinium natans]|uniref:Chpt1 protein n=1 Tax=Symbiodinium natans TaxID=878477 RepID=A0A812Q9U9_9DINO|nr:chpt1 [Symbiodinium natans]